MDSPPKADDREFDRDFEKRKKNNDAIMSFFDLHELYSFAVDIK